MFHGTQCGIAMEWFSDRRDVNGVVSLILGHVVTLGLLAMSRACGWTCWHWTARKLGSQAYNPSHACLGDGRSRGWRCKRACKLQGTARSNPIRPEPRPTPALSTPPFQSRCLAQKKMAASWPLLAWPVAKGSGRLHTVNAESLGAGGPVVWEGLYPVARSEQAILQMVQLERCCRHESVHHTTPHTHLSESRGPDPPPMQAVMAQERVFSMQVSGPRPCILFPCL